VSALSGIGLIHRLPPIPIAWVAGQILFWLLLFALFAAWMRSLPFLCGALGQASVLLMWGAFGLYHLTRGTALEAGAQAIAAGLVIFAVAAGISFMKARRGRSASN
jgi:hypothetical protein